jgi:hypothetical protein
MAPPQRPPPRRNWGFPRWVMPILHNIRHGVVLGGSALILIALIVG